MGQGAYIFGCAGPELTESEAAFFREADPWGFILFARNVSSGDQVRRLTHDLREAVGRDAPILVDQEGGRVHRLPPPVWRNWPPPLDHATSASEPERALFFRYQLIALELRDVGIDVNCVPCADIAGDATHPFLRNRCYGTTAADVISRSRAVADGCLAGGALPVMKHMPGHGRGAVDSHVGLPATDATRDELLESDFAVFRALSDLPLGMTAHMVYAALDPERPGTLSPSVNRAIRRDIGFDGFLMTDDLSMGALGGSVRERSRRALDAGCDSILHCNGEMEEMAAVAAEAGTMTEAANARAEAALALRKSPAAIDIPVVEAELEALSRTGR